MYILRQSRNENNGCPTNLMKNLMENLMKNLMKTRVVSSGPEDD